MKTYTDRSSATILRKPLADRITLIAEASGSSQVESSSWDSILLKHVDIPRVYLVSWNRTWENDTGNPLEGEISPNALTIPVDTLRTTPFWTDS